MRSLILCLGLIPFLLGGCGSLLKTEYVRPEVTIPQDWSAQENEDTTVADNAAEWPSDFSDQKLSQLVALALERNNDLAAASIRVRQAQLQAGIAYQDLWPDLSATIKGNNSKDLTNGETAASYSGTLGISYEADLWGKLSRTHDAATWEAVATDEDRRSAALSLVSTTMKLYWEIAYDNVRLDLSTRNIESSEETLKLMMAQEQYGAASDLEVNEARQDLASLKADRCELEQERQEDITALAVLFDSPPGKVMADPQKLTAADLPAIPAGLPADLLGRRPDLRAAELRLRKLLANTDAAEASFYPTISLTGTLGSSAERLSELLDNPIAALASTLAFPFLNWNELELNVEVSKAEYDEAVATFRQTLYEAMKEVEDGLSERQSLIQKGESLNNSLEAAREVERIYAVRYSSGSGTLKDWLDAQDTRRSAEQAVAQNTYNRLMNIVTLYQALGGRPASTTAH